MDREILFRAWHRELKKMFWFDLMWGQMNNRGSGWIGMIPIEQTQLKKINSFSDYDDRVPVDPDECELMRFTGLCDKNGVKIFEGDVCRSSSHYENGVLVYNYHAIEWSDKYSGWFAKNTANIGKENTHGDVQLWVYFRNCEPEVIGNIYDNPELLK